MQLLKKIVIGATLLGFTALMYSSEGPGAFPIKDNQGTVFQISPEDVKLLMLCKTIQKMNQSIIVSTTQDVVKCDPSRESCLSYAADTIQQLIGSMQQDVSNSTMSSTANIQQFISLLRILSTMINLEETSIKELEPLMKELGQKITIKNPIALFEIANYLEAPNAALCIIAELAYPCLPSLSQCSDKEKRLYQEIIPLLSYYPTFTELIAEKGMKFLESEECLKHTRVSIGGINSDMTILTTRTGKKIHSLDGIEQLADWPIAQMVWELNLNNHHISDFNMEKLVTIFPRLKIVSLCNNNITTLRPEMIAGTVYMSDDANRSEISLMRNPITTIETECFDSVANLKEVHIYTSSPLADSLIKQIEKAIEKHEQQFKKEDNAVKRYIVKQAALIKAPLLAAALFYGSLAIGLTYRTYHRWSDLHWPVEIFDVLIPGALAGISISFSGIFLKEFYRESNGRIRSAQNLAAEHRDCNAKINMLPGYESLTFRKPLEKPEMPIEWLTNFTRVLRNAPNATMRASVQTYQSLGSIMANLRNRILG